MYRGKFNTHYFCSELDCFRWIQLTKKQVSDYKMEIKRAHEYLDEDGTTKYKFHVDDYPSVSDVVVDNPFGGNLSIRKDPDTKPLIIFGQDECIFKQNITHNSTWVGPNGERPMVPKDDGQGLMVSAFCSREFGFGMPVTQSQLDEFNNKRRNKNYRVSESAIAKYGTPVKRKLTKSPFVRQLEYGANKDGYWDYHQMCIQFEDIVDWLQHFHTSFDFKFLFDQSNGHDMMRLMACQFPSYQNIMVECNQK